MTEEAVPEVWKATMTPKEAGVWASESALRDVLYHGTSREGAVDIRKFGFRVKEGKPVFLTRNKRTAEAFAGIAEEPEVLPVAVNVRKVQLLDFNKSETLAKVGSKHPAGSGAWVDDVLAWYNKEYTRLVEEGYDAIDVVVHLRTGAPIDHNQVILTNPEKITVLTKDVVLPKPPAVKTEVLPMSVVEYDRRYTLEELREMARQGGLSPSGSKKEIATRLIAKGVR